MSIRQIFKDFDLRVTLSGHSGGGRFIFVRLLTAFDRIPDDIERIAFVCYQLRITARKQTYYG